MYASPFDNYWVVADQPANLRWSSAGVAYVADTDATYTAWLAAGFEASYIDTEQELADLLNETYPAGSPLPAPPPSTSALGPMTVDLVLATTLLAALGEAIGGIEAIELIEGGGPIPETLPDAPGIGLLAGADTTGSYTVPAGVYKLIIFGQAAGGGGGNCTAATAQVGGGGGPGETRCMVLAVQPGQILNYTIGGRGLGGSGIANDTIIGGTPNPAPSVKAAVACDNSFATSTSFAVTLPASVAGDLLMIMVRTSAGNPQTPAGWTLLNLTTFSTAGAGAIFYKIAAGSEGLSVTVTCASATNWRAIAYVITGHDPAAPPTFVSTNGTGTAPNCTALTIAGGLQKLWLAVAMGSSNLSGVPSGFHDPPPPPASLITSVRSSQYESNATTVDPTAYTQASSSAFVVFTVGQKAPAAPAAMTCKGGLAGGAAAGGTNGTMAGDPPTGSGGVRIPPAGSSFGVAQASLCWCRAGSSFFGRGGDNIRTSTMGGGTQGGPGAGGAGGGNGSGTTAQAGADGGPGLILIFGFGK